jgi:transposase
MKHYAGLDVSIKETSICIIDETGKVCREKKVMSHPDDLVVLLNDPQFPLARVGLEAGPLSQWLYEALAKAGLPVICIETRHAKSFLKAQQTNKSDRNDARGIAQMMRVDLFKAVHVKTLTSQIRRALLTARDGLQRNALAIENEIRGILRNFGLKVGMIGSVKYEERIRELLEGMPDLLAESIERLLDSRRNARDNLAKLDRKVRGTAKSDPVCRQLMSVPGVGPVIALAYTSTIDVPGRFRNSRAVGAALGLTPVLHQSGESKRTGHVSLHGDALRGLLYEGAQVMLTRVKKWSWLKAWAMNVAKRHGAKKAIVALARRLAVILHRMWIDGSTFRWTRETKTATA